MIRSGRLPLWNGSAGCGAPHLANGQSAVFDPFNLLAYLGSVPSALGWMAACRLWVAGLGMFLLARQWGLGRWGRWFAGLAYPFSGFLVVWLLYPVTAVAVWMPWLFLATEGLFRAPTARAAGLAGDRRRARRPGRSHPDKCARPASGRACMRLLGSSGRRKNRPAALEPRSAGRSEFVSGSGSQACRFCRWLPIWRRARSGASDSSSDTAWWKIERPRLLDMVCTAVPYAYGSQRRGHPNLAKALGVNNLNESAGGFAGLGTLIWLAPLAVVTRGRTFRVAFLAALALFGRTGSVSIAARRQPAARASCTRRHRQPPAHALGRRSLWCCWAGSASTSSPIHVGCRAPWIVAWVVGAVVLGALACAIGHVRRPAQRASAVALS